LAANNKNHFRTDKLTKNQPMFTVEEKKTGQGSLRHRLGLFLLFLSLGLLIFFVFSHFRPLIPGNMELFSRIALIVALLITTLIVFRSQRFNKYWLVFYAFFIAACAQALDYYFNDWALNILDLSINTPAGIAISKLESTIMIVVPILILTRASGNDLASIYIQKGKLRTGLIIGGIVFLLVALISIPWAKWQYQTGDLSLERVVPWIPWIIIFVLANSINEELLFRGLFLRKLEPFLGSFLSNLCIAIPFTMLHFGVDYSQNFLMFLGFLLPLGLVLGYVMQKTDSILGAWLIHASVDIAVILALFSRL
jgi:membrane protease YdiL (CAAX protease family)